MFGLLIRGALLQCLNAVSKKKPTLLLQREEDCLNMPHLQVPMVFQINNQALRVTVENQRHFSRWRGLANATKEPATIEWVRALPPDAVFYDIGANVGNYCILAQLLNPAMSVFAFEPEPSSFAALCRTIGLNKLNVKAYCFALSDKTGIDELHLTQIGVGYSDHQLSRTVNQSGQPFVPAFTVGVARFALDDLVTQNAFPGPTHVKIDVDGIESDVVRGMEALLASPRLQSIAIEISDKASFDICHGLLKRNGFVCGIDEFDPHCKMLFYNCKV